MLIAAAFAFFVLIMILDRKRAGIYIFENFIVYKKSKIKVDNIRYIKITRFNQIRIYSKSKVSAKAQMGDTNIDKLLEWIKMHKIPIPDTQSKHLKSSESV